MQLKSFLLAAALLPFISAAPVAVAEPAIGAPLYEKSTAYSIIKDRSPTELYEKAADYSIIKERKQTEEKKRGDLYIDATYYDKE
jgi:hypothetical protein